MDHAVINLPGKKKFTIDVKNNSAANIYIQQVTLNGKPYTKSYIRYSDIMNGGDMILEMANKPSTTWGTAKEDWAASKSF